MEEFWESMTGKEEKKKSKSRAFSTQAKTTS